MGPRHHTSAHHLEPSEDPAEVFERCRGLVAEGKLSSSVLSLHLLVARSDVPQNLRTEAITLLGRAFSRLLG